MLKYEFKRKFCGNQFMFIHSYFDINRGFTIYFTGEFYVRNIEWLSIEQTLMKTMKTSDKITRGCGVNKKIPVRLTLVMAPFQEVCEIIETFFGAAKFVSWKLWKLYLLKKKFQSLDCCICKKKIIVVFEM